METASGPVQLKVSADAAVLGLHKAQVSFGGVDLIADATKVRPYRAVTA